MQIVMICMLPLLHFYLTLVWQSKSRQATFLSIDLSTSSFCTSLCPKQVFLHPGLGVRMKNQRKTPVWCRMCMLPLLINTIAGRYEYLNHLNQTHMVFLRCRQDAPTRSWLRTADSFTFSRDLQAEVFNRRWRARIILDLRTNCILTWFSLARQQASNRGNS